MNGRETNSHLVLEEKDAVRHDSGYWKPFEDVDDFEERQWWIGPAYRARDHRHYFSAMRDQLEVARLEVDSAPILDGYQLSPVTQRSSVEIVYIEVAVNERCNGVGPAVTNLVAQHFPGRRVTARSKLSVERFWSEKLRWARHEHLTDPGLYPPLYVGPTSAP